MSNEVKKYNPYRDAYGRFASAGTAGAGGAGGSKKTNADGKPLSASDDKKLNNLAIEMWNHKQSVPMSVRTGNMKTPSAQAHIREGQRIVTEANNIFGGSREETMSELNRRMGS